MTNSLQAVFGLWLTAGTLSKEEKRYDTSDMLIHGLCVFNEEVWAWRAAVMQHDETTNEELTFIVSGAGLLPALDISNKNRYIYTIKSNKGLLFLLKKENKGTWFKNCA